MFWKNLGISAAIALGVVAIVEGCKAGVRALRRRSQRRSAEASTEANKTIAALLAHTTDLSPEVVAEALAPAKRKKAAN